MTVWHSDRTELLTRGLLEHEIQRLSASFKQIHPRTTAWYVAWCVHLDTVERDVVSCTRMHVLLVAKQELMRCVTIRR